MICIVLSFIFIYEVINEFLLIKSMLLSISDCDIICKLYLTPLLLTPIAIILFWRRKKIGWILICFLISFTAFTILLSFIEWNGTSQIANRIIALAFNSAIIWVINKDDIRNIFNIKRQDALIPFIAALIIALMIELVY